MTLEQCENPNFYLFAAGSAVFYIAAQSFQEVLFCLLKPGDTLQAEIAFRATSLDQMHDLLILLSIFFCIPVFAAIALHFFQRSSASALLGFAFSVFFVITEVLYRSIDLFVVSRLWATQYLSAQSDATRTALATRIQLWNEVVRGWYFPLLLALFAASLSFALAAWSRQEWRDRMLSLAFQFNALRLLIRLAGEFGGVGRFVRIAYAIYFPAVLIVFGCIAYWLLAHAAEIKLSQRKTAA